MPYSKKAGVITFVGHALTQRWHAVQVFVKWATPDDPGGVIGNFFSDRMSFAEKRTGDPADKIEPPATAELTRNVLLDKADSPPVTDWISNSYLTTDFLHTSTQLKQATHRV